MPRADGPFEILEDINNNAYKVDLPVYYGVSATFNVADLSSHKEDDYLYDLRSNHLKQGEDNVIQSDTSQLNSPSQANLIMHVQLQETSFVLQVQKEMVPRFNPLACTWVVFFYYFIVRTTSKLYNSFFVSLGRMSSLFFMGSTKAEE